VKRVNVRNVTFAILALALSHLFASVTIPPVHAAERVMIATPSRGLFEFPAVIAMKNGYFKNEGLEVEKIQIQPQIAVKALVAGDVGYTLAWGSALRAAVTGIPLKVVSTIASRPLHVLVARPEIRSGPELRGKTLGVDSFAGTVDYLSRIAARHYGLDPDKDVKIIVTGPSPLRLAALKAGSIDATPIDIAYAVKAEEEGFRRLLYLGDIIDLPLSGIAVTNQKIANEREQIKKVIRATLRGTAFMKKNRAATVKLMSEYLGLSPAQSAKTYDSAVHSFTDDGFITDKALLLDVQLARERLKITKEIPLNQVADWSLLKEIAGIDRNRNR
jgi:NitT/TauT family transport system substrate-binding protein